MNMIGSDILLLIKKFEGFRSKAYKCAGGYLTIGYGHLTNDEHKEINEIEAEILLKQDLQIAVKAINRLVNVELKQNQCDALLSFIFNVGSGAFQRSVMRQKINRDEHELVPEEFMKWVWAGGKKQAGLIKRRLLESNIYSNIYF
jgi:lysozyme